MKTKNGEDCNNSIIGKIFECYRNELKAYCLCYTHNEMDAEDMVHDVFLKLLGLDIINESTAKHLIFTIARRMIVDDVRHHRRVKMAEQYLRQCTDIADCYYIYDKMDCDYILHLQEQCLNSMPAKRAQVFRMWRDETGSKEIAGQLNISKRTVEAHVYQALRQIREYVHKAI
ncbi:MAG: sigma-70 family RNA polymerase sigma factor [Prevotella sp.]